MTPLDPSDPPRIKLAWVIQKLRFSQGQAARMLDCTVEDLEKILAGELCPNYETRLRAANYASACAIDLPVLSWLSPAIRGILKELGADVEEQGADGQLLTIPEEGSPEYEALTMAEQAEADQARHFAQEDADLARGLLFDTAKPEQEGNFSNILPEPPPPPLPPPLPPNLPGKGNGAKRKNGQ
jgi:hypothetical protein